MRMYVHLQFINPYSIEGSSHTFMYVLPKLLPALSPLNNYTLLIMSFVK